MMRTETRLRLLGLTLACASLATALAGCGGGGSSATPPPASGPAPSESAFLLAEFVATDSNHQFVRVWDPANAAVAVQNVRLVMSNGIPWTSSHLVFSDATRYDAAARSVTTLGHAKVFYDNDGKLYSIDLRGGQSHVPVQLSSAVDVFLPSGATPMNAAGDDAWVDVQGGSHHWAIRATMSATDAPVDILQIVAPLRDAATGLPQYFLATLGERSGEHVLPATYEAVDADFRPLDVPAIAAMVSTDGWAGADPGQPGLGYLVIANGLHELHWGAGGVAVDAASLRAFGNVAPATPVADAQSLYLNDGPTLLSLANGIVRTVGSFAIAPATLVDAGDYVAGVEISGATSTQARYQVETLDKSGGAVTLVEPAATTLRLLAASERGLVLVGTAEQPQAFVLASGDNATRTSLGSQWVGIVRAASARVDQPAVPVALLSCVAGATDFCAPGALTQLDLSGSATALGTVAASAPMLRGDAIAGLAASLPGQTLLATAGGFGGDETDARDAWQFTPAAAGSLTRVTSSVP
jgi:hypothetical protein